LGKTLAPVTSSIPPTRSVGRLLSEEIRGRIPLGILHLGRHRARYLASFSLTPAVLR
jgi:hypothetical protein